MPSVEAWFSSFSFSVCPSGAVSYTHLDVYKRQILRDAGLVLDDKQGKYIYYELNMSVVDEILEWITALKGGEQNEKNH